MRSTNLTHLLSDLHQGQSILDCQDASFSTAELKVLMEAMASVRHVESLNLSFQPINEPLLPLLQKGIQQQPLKVLTLKKTTLSAHAAHDLGNILGEAKHLRHLDLSDNALHDQGIKNLTPGLLRNQSLEHLDLTKNNIGDEGAQALAQAIAQHPTLINMHLFDNQIGDEGASALAQKVVLSRTLHSLGLSLNKIGDKGALALAKAVKQSDTLRSLYLASNFFGEQALRHLEEAIHQHPSMEKLFLLLRQGRLAGKLRKFRDLLS